MDKKDVALHLACAVISSQKMELNEDSAKKVIAFYDLILKKLDNDTDDSPMEHWNALAKE